MVVPFWTPITPLAGSFLHADPQVWRGCAVLLAGPVPVCAMAVWVAVYATDGAFFALVQMSVGSHIGGAFQASSPKTFHRPVLRDRPFFVWNGRAAGLAGSRPGCVPPRQCQTHSLSSRAWRRPARRRCACAGPRPVICCGPRTPRCGHFPTARSWPDCLDIAIRKRGGEDIFAFCHGRYSLARCGNRGVACLLMRGHRLCNGR